MLRLILQKEFVKSDMNVMNITKKHNNKSRSSGRVKTQANNDQYVRQDLKFVQDIFKPKKSVKSNSKAKLSHKSKTKTDSCKILHKHTDSIQSSRNGQLRKQKEGKQNSKKVVQKKQSNEIKLSKKKLKKSVDGRVKTLMSLNQYNTSRSHSKDKSRSKSKLKTRPRCNTSRNNEPLQKMRKSQCVKSTKIVTQRSWLNDHSSKKVQNSEKNDKVTNRLSNNNPKKKKIKRTVTTFQNQNYSTLKFGDSRKLQMQKLKTNNKNHQQNDEQQQDSAPSTFRKKLLRIKTQFSQRKQQFFDSNQFTDLNVKCVQSIQEQNLVFTKPTGNKYKTNNFSIDQQQTHKCNRKLFQSRQSIVQFYRQKQISTKNVATSSCFKKCKLEDQEIQTQKIESKYCTPKHLKLESKNITQSGHSELKCFKKMQELKWRVVLLQLKQIQSEQQKISDGITQSRKALFQAKKISKLNQIIEQLDSNVRDVIVGADYFSSNQKSRNNYALQNPVKVISALNSHSSSKKSLFQERQKQKQNKKQADAVEQNEINFLNFQPDRKDSDYIEQNANNYVKRQNEQKGIQFQGFRNKQNFNQSDKFIIFDGLNIYQQYNQNNNQSDKNLLEQLQKIKPCLQLQDFQEKQDSHLQHLSLQKNFSEQLQKELDQYSSAEHAKNSDDKKHENKQQIEIFELDIQNIENKRIVSLEVTDLLMNQVALQIVKNKMFLHMFLNACLKDAKAKQNDQEKLNFRRQKFDTESKENSFSQYRIQCDKTYSLELLTRLLDFIQTQNGIKDQILVKINSPFGSDHLKTLKWVREYYHEQKQQSEELQEHEDLIDHKEEYLQQEQSVSNQLPQQTTFLTQAILNEFESKNMNELAHQQYFFNHCVYNCMNQIMDTLRPYGVSGKPCICARATVKPKEHKNFLQIVAKIARNFIQIISVRAGRTAIQQRGVILPNDNGQFLHVNKKTNEIMDKIAIKEEQEKWGNFQDYTFQNKYYLSEKIIEDIFLEECMLVFTEFFQ